MMSRPARLLCLLIGLYQRAFAWRPSPCRFSPTCSTYARQAVELHGAARGGWLAARRLLRCQPWGGFGMDPVPQPAAPQAAAPAAANGTRTHV